MTIPELRQIEDKYEILGKLGEGGMGVVYKVRHRLLDELRVVKVMHGALRGDEELAARFRREARIATRLKHPNIAQLYDFALGDQGTAFIIMEYLEGQTLRQLLASSGPPELELTLEIADQSLAALGHLHRKGFVHRDVSPDNLMLTTADGEPRVKLIDLGLARGTGGKTAPRMTMPGTFLGKLRYSSPEQLGAAGFADLDARSDVYSFGIILYELLTGRFPIAGNDPATIMAAHLYSSPLDFEVSDPGGKVAVQLRAIVLKALARQPAARFADAGEFARALRSFREWTVSAGKAGAMDSTATRVLPRKRTPAPAVDPAAEEPTELLPQPAAPQPAAPQPAAPQPAAPWDDRMIRPQAAGGAPYAVAAPAPGARRGRRKAVAGGLAVGLVAAAALAAWWWRPWSPAPQADRAAATDPAADRERAVPTQTAEGAGQDAAARAAPAVEDAALPAGKTAATETDGGVGEEPTAADGGVEEEPTELDGGAEQEPAELGGKVEEAPAVAEDPRPAAPPPAVVEESASRAAAPAAAPSPSEPGPEQAIAGHEPEQAIAGREPQRAPPGDPELERVLADAAKAGEKQRPREGLMILSSVKPSGEYEERFRQARQRLERLLAELDAAAPQIAVPTGHRLEYPAGQTGKITLTVSDDYGVEDVRIWLRLEGETEFRAFPIARHSGTTVVDVPVALHRNQTVEFYVRAVDYSGHAGWLGSAQAPLKFRPGSGP